MQNWRRRGSTYKQIQTVLDYRYLVFSVIHITFDTTISIVSMWKSFIWSVQTWCRCEMLRIWNANNLKMILYTYSNTFVDDKIILQWCKKHQILWQELHEQFLEVWSSPQLSSPIPVYIFKMYKSMSHFNGAAITGTFQANTCKTDRDRCGGIST